MSLFHTKDGTEDRFPVTFFTEKVVSIRDGYFGYDSPMSRVSLSNMEKEYIPESEGRRLRDVLELEQATEDEIELCLDHEQIAKLTEAAETNPESAGFCIRVQAFDYVPPAQIDL